MSEEADQGTPGVATWVRRVAPRLLPVSNVSIAMAPSTIGIRSAYAIELSTARGHGLPTQEKMAP